MIITLEVVTIPGVTSRYQDTIGSFLERLQHELWIHTSGTHHLDDADVRGILEAGCSGQISTGVATPVAKEPDDFRLPVNLGLIGSG